MSFDMSNVIHSGPEGRFLESGTTKADVDAIVARIMTGERTVLHFHGGLVNERTGMTIARNVAAAYGEAGAYPVTFVWRSGILEVLPANLHEIAGESLFKTLLKWVTKYALGKIRQDIKGMRGGVLALPRDIEVARELNRRNTGQEPYDQVTCPRASPSPPRPSWRPLSATWPCNRLFGRSRRPWPRPNSQRQRRSQNGVSSCEWPPPTPFWTQTLSPSCALRPPAEPVSAG
jgi:hypothetical protein